MKSETLNLIVEHHGLKCKVVRMLSARTMDMSKKYTACSAIFLEGPNKDKMTTIRYDENGVSF